MTFEWRYFQTIPLVKQYPRYNNHAYSSYPSSFTPLSFFVEWTIAVLFFKRSIHVPDHSALRWRYTRVVSGIMLDRSRCFPRRADSDEITGISRVFWTGEIKKRILQITGELWISRTAIYPTGWCVRSVGFPGNYERVAFLGDLWILLQYRFICIKELDLLR